jgi:hypothetical protein
VHRAGRLSGLCSRTCRLTLQQGVTGPCEEACMCTQVVVKHVVADASILYEAALCCLESETALGMSMCTSTQSE